jgi:chitodextrinase
MTVSAASTRNILSLLVVSLACLLFLAEGASGGERGKPDRPPGRDRESPTAPTNLRVTSATTSSISLAWNPSTDDVRVRGYDVYVKGDRSTVRNTAYTIRGLSCGESVAVEVEAFDKAGNRSSGTGATVSSAPCPDRSPPSAPTGFRQVATSDTAVVVAWVASTDDEGVVGYGIYRSGLPVATSAEPSVTLSPLSCGSTYEFAVDAVDAAGNRSSRSPVWVVTSPCATPPPGDTEPPSKPLTSLGTSTPTSLLLRWQPAVDNVGVHHYDVFVATSAVASAQQKVGETTALSYTFGALACGTDYSLAVRAVDAAGNKSALAEVPARTLDCLTPAPPPDTTPPSDPGNLAVAAATASSIALTWSASTDNVGVTGYGVYRNGTSLPAVTQPGTTVSGLQCGTAYTLSVDAYDAAGNRSSRAAVTASTAACPDTQAPTAPANVTASSRTTTSIALTWSPSTDSVGVTGYGLYRGGQFVGTATGSTGIFSDLTCNTGYTLSVDAYDAAGNRSAKTTVMVATTACPAPPPPTITMGESSIMGVNDSGNGNLLVSQKATLAHTGILRRLSFYVTNAAGNLRLGVYTATGPSGGPGQKLAETVSFTPTAGWNTVNVLSPVTLAAGSYWLAYLPSSSSLGFRVGSGGEARWQSYSYGSMPATFSSSPSGDSVHWSLYATLDVSDQAPAPPPPADCADGVDNDADGRTDLGDPGCSDAADDNEADPAPAPPPSAGTPTLQQVDGGLGYYGQFSNPLPTSASYFPIGVWGAYNQTTENRNRDAAVGINTYAWAADPAFFDDIRADGRFFTVVDGATGGVGPETIGRLLGDEVDMTQGPSACPNAINAAKASLPADGRARYANYGKGVLIWGATGFGGHNDTSSACFVNAQDITSTDLYWHTDPNETNHPQSGTSWGYGWSMERMRMLDAKDGKRTPQWGFVEVTDAMNGGSPITPAEIRGAVWHTLIAGARGILYFQHDFAGSCTSHHALRETGSACYGAVIDTVTSVNAQIRSLASVLNSPFVTSGHSASTSIEHMVKWNGSNLYVFAAARSGGNATFSMPCIGNATATVIGENRAVAVSGGSFTDSFADGNAAHIYRIDGGSCGLS